MNDFAGPRGWTYSKLGEYVRVTTGKLDANAQTADGSYPFFTCGAEVLRIDQYAFDTEAVLLAGNGNFNVKYKGKFNAYQRTYVIEPIHIGLKFLHYQMLHLLPAIVKGNRGSTVRFIRLGDIVDCEAGLPPIPEQARIVAEIEKHFTRLDAAVAALKRVQANQKRYRAAVLKAACEGRLVPTEAELARREDRTYETGAQLLSRLLKDLRTKWETAQLEKIPAGQQPGSDDWKKKYKEPGPLDATKLPDLPEGWTWASVKQVGQVQLGRQRAPKYHAGDFMRPYLRVANVFEDRIDVSDVLQMTFTPSEFQIYELRHGDILLNEGQSLELIGRPAMYRNEVPGACFQNTLVRFRAAQGLEPRFALIVFLSYLHKNRFQKIAKWTTNIAHLGAERFAGLEFPLPPFSEQVRIADYVEHRISVLRNMEGSARLNSKRAQRLRQSILKRAFAGKLVSQDPSDEPASMLLERIRADRVKSEAADLLHKPRRAKVAAVEAS